MRNYILLIIFFLTFPILATNPVAEFCAKNHIISKSLLIAVTPSDCYGCIRPLDKVLSKIKSINPNIQIYFVTHEPLSSNEELLFQAKLGIQELNVELLTDKDTHDYIVSEKEGIPSICCVSGFSILCIKNLKNEDLEPIYAQIAPELEVNTLKTIELKNKFISTYRANGNYYTKQANNFFIFYSQYNLFSKYDKEGNNIKNIFIDSLKINYLELAKALFSSADYQSTCQHIQKLKDSNKRYKFISPISLVKINNDTVALATKISSFKDTIYKKQNGTFESEYACLLLFNKDLQYIGYLKFNSTDAKRIEPYCQISSLNSSLYFLKYNKPTDNFFLAEYKIKKDSLQLIAQYEEPYRPKEGEILQSICPHNSNQSSVFITYNADKDKYVNVFKFDIITHTFTKVIQASNLHVLGSTINQTKNGNYIFLANKPGKDLSVYGYNSLKQKFVNAVNIESDKISNFENHTIKLGLNNDILEVSYSE